MNFTVLSPVTSIVVRDSLMVRMGACRVPDRGSIPRRGVFFISSNSNLAVISSEYSSLRSDEYSSGEMTRIL